MHNEISDVLLGHKQSHRFGADGTGGQRVSRLMFPGSFNPLHAGHLEMARLASSRCHGPVEFEMSVINVDKAALGYHEIFARLAQFDTRTPVWLTRAATFAQKATLFPETTFIVGADTAVRILEPRYYDDEKDRDAALACLASHGCRFLVFGRLIHNEFIVGAKLRFPADVAELFELVPEADFREDISSTELRGRRGGA